MALTTLLRRCALAAALTLPLAASAGTGQIFIVNTDGANEGFNDPTPALPVGGNPGTTVGQQRLIAFQYAADIWGAVLDTDVDIYIRAAFNPLTCTATAAVLGSAGSIVFNRDFAGAELPATWYHIALANKLEGVDAIPAPGLPGLPHEDIQATFNSEIGKPGCFVGSGWYYGLDHNEGPLEDLVAVLMHEFGHGLGFANRINETNGQLPGGFADIYTAYTFDNTQNKRWTEMTDAERVTSAINGRRVSWDGINVTRAVPGRLALGVPTLTVSAPASIAGEYLIGPAAFGPAFPTTPLSAPVVLGQDAVEPGGGTATDGCSPLTNAVAGMIVLVDRGFCTFNIKVANAQNAGAVAVLVADNVAGSPPANLAGTDPTITIPSGRITRADGLTFKANLVGLVAALGVDMTRRQGADSSDRALLYAVDPVALGSSISHFDTSASPNLLMEPFINDDLTDSLDLTLPLMTDIGWFSDYDGVPDGEDACIGSDRRETVVVGSCDSGAANVVFPDGCRVSDSVDQCKAGAANHDAYVECVSNFANALKKAGVYSGRDQGQLTACVSRSP